MVSCVFVHKAELEFFNISVAFCMIIRIQFVMMCVPFVAREGSASTVI